MRTATHKLPEPPDPQMVLTRAVRVLHVFDRNLDPEVKGLIQLLMSRVKTDHNIPVASHQVNADTLLLKYF